MKKSTTQPNRDAITISVVVPSFNSKCTIRETLGAIFGQKTKYVITLLPDATQLSSTNVATKPRVCG